MIIAGDINQLLIKDFCLQNNLLQLVTKLTRGKKTLDVFITNYPHLWKSPASFKGLVRSDHMTIVVNPQFQAKPERKYVCFRDVREHRKIKMEKKLAEYDWSTIASVQDMDTAACKLSDSILSLVNECFPPKKVRISSRDSPFMSPVVKHLRNLRNNAYYTTPDRVVIPDDTSLPMIEAHVVEKFLMKQKRTAPGPDEIPYWIWRDYAPYLAPMVTKIVNLSLNQQHVP